MGTDAPMITGGLIDQKEIDYEKLDKEFSGYIEKIQAIESGKGLKKQDKLYDNDLKQAINKNPYPFLEITYFLDKDITPCLDKIPDGEYIQFFNEFLGIIPAYHLDRALVAVFKR